MTSSWERASGDPLDLQAEAFASEVDDLLAAVLAGAPPVRARRVANEHDRWVVAPFDEAGNRLRIPLTVDEEHVADLDVSMKCRLDSRGQWLTIDQSKFELKACIDRTPIIRLEYDRDSYNKPSAHLHVHAQRGALSHMLSRAGHEAPHAMESLHIPLGGARFRPCIEDFLEMLFHQFRFQARDGWRDHLAGGRERWRRTQLAATVRDCPDEAVRVLREMQYSVADPDSGPGSVHTDRLRQW